MTERMMLSSAGRFGVLPGAFAVRRRVLHHSIRRKRAERVPSTHLGTRHAVCGCACEAGLPPFFAPMLTGRAVACAGNRGLGHAAADGDLFPPVHAARGRRLPSRVAFQLDHAFQCARASGKQSLTMHGLRATPAAWRLPHHRLAAGAADCHPHQQLLCRNGRFPPLIFLCSVFFAAARQAGALPDRRIAASVGLTSLCRAFSLATVLRGEAVSFALELPPYRMPQIGRVIVRSVRDRDAVCPESHAAVAAPAGVLSSGFLPMCR